METVLANLNGAGLEKSLADNDKYATVMDRCPAPATSSRTSPGTSIPSPSLPLGQRLAGGHRPGPFPCSAWMACKPSAVR